jgi:uncharacterized membrane protein YraQ (UPF0718 family)
VRPAVFVIAGSALLAAVFFTPQQLEAARWLPDARRAFVYASSIMLEAGPFVACGAVAAWFTLARIRDAQHWLPAVIAMCAPGCDCSMNGFAAALARCPRWLAGVALTWGAACNPVALAATWLVLGPRVFAARIAGAAVAACAIALLWRGDHRTVGAEADGAAEFIRPQPGDPLCEIASHLEAGLCALVPAAIASAVFAACFGHAMRAHQPLLAAAAGAILSPCSTADAILAKIVTGSASAQAAFVIAGQCLDLRQLSLLRRHFGIWRAWLGACAGALGCAAAVLVAR